VTIIWALQSGTSAEGTSRSLLVRARHLRASGVQLGGLWSVVSFPGGSGAEPRPPAFSCIYIIQYTDKIWANFWPPTHKHTAANSAVCQCRDKSGTPSPKRDKWASREKCDFFRNTSLKIGTVRVNPRRMVTLGCLSL